MRLVCQSCQHNHGEGCAEKDFFTYLLVAAATGAAAARAAAARAAAAAAMGRAAAATGVPGAGERGSHGECGGVGGSGGGVAGGSGGDGGGVYSYYLLTYLLEARGATWRAVAWSSQLALAFICSILIGSSSLEGALGSETWPRPGPARACSVVGPERRTSAMLLGVAARLERLSL